MKSIYVLESADAARVVEVICAELVRRGRGAAVAVVDAHGELMAFRRTDGCPLASIVIAIDKAFTSARERMESAEVGRRSREEGWPMSNFGDLRYTAWGGGVPLLRAGQVVGGVGVSGMPEADDIELARQGAAALEGANA